MIKQQLFTPTIYNRGLDYYQRGKVIRLSDSDNEYFAVVKGNEDYHVSIKYNPDGKVIFMECDCPYAEDGRHCKHEAALFIDIKNEKQAQMNKNIEEQHSLTHAYFMISRNHRKPQIIHRLFLNELKERFERINIDAIEYSQECFSRVIKLLKEIDELSYSQKYIDSVYDKFLEEFQILISLNSSYRQDIHQWLKQNIIEGKYLFYFHYFIDFIHTLPSDKIIHECKDILLNLQYINLHYVNALLAFIDQALEESDIDISILLKELEKFDDMEMYQKIKADYFIQKQDYHSALNCIQYFKDNHHMIDEYVFDFLEEDIYYHLNNKEAYQRIITQLIHTYNDIDDLMYIHKLKELYQEDWINECYEFYDKLLDGFDDDFIYYILTNQNEIKYIVSYIMEHLTLNNIKKYKDIIKEYDSSMYQYLLTLFVIEESKKAKNQSQYMIINHYLAQLINEGCSLETIGEIRYLIEKENPKKTVLHDVLAEFVDGKDDDLLYDEDIML